MPLLANDSVQPWRGPDLGRSDGDGAGETSTESTDAVRVGFGYEEIPERLQLGKFPRETKAFKQKLQQDAVSQKQLTKIHKASKLGNKVVLTLEWGMLLCVSGLYGSSVSVQNIMEVF